MYLEKNICESELFISGGTVEVEEVIVIINLSMPKNKKLIW